MIRPLKLGDIEKVVTLSDGSFVTYFHGFKYPVHGLLTREALDATDMLKKYIIGWVRTMTGRPQRYLTALSLFLSNNLIKDWVREFERYSEHVTEIYMDTRHISPAVREFYNATITILGERKHFILALCAILEHDKAYRYRLQDILMYADKEEMIKNPAKEVTRLVELYIQREKRKEYHSIGFLVKLGLFFYPELKKWIKQFAIETDFTKYTLDTYDLFGCLREEAYDFGGKSPEQRMDKWRNL